MDVSVIIPALNEAELIGRAVRSAWTAGAREVLVADGGSQDETRAIAASLGCRVVESPAGRATQQNLAARLARGEFLLFQHADNWLSPGSIAQIRTAALKTRARCGAFRQQITAAGWKYRLLERGNAWRARRLQMPLGDQGIFLDRHLFQQLGGFPEVRLMEEVLLMKRVRRVARPVLLPGPLFVEPRRWQRYGVVRQTLRNWSLLAAFQIGVPADFLARFYPRHDKPTT